MAVMWTDSPTFVTAEWLCTRCGATNRKLLPAGTREAGDRCVHCGLKHQVTAGATPVRWDARAR